jgi:glycosyltransferase involved in cell wall biosynthesis
LEGYVSDLNDALADSGEVERITVLTPRLPQHGAAVEQRGERYIVLRYPAFELIPNFPVPKLWRPQLWRLLRSADPAAHDVFVSHTRFFLTSALALLCARVVHRPLLHVEHGSDFVQLSGRVQRAGARAYDLLLGRLLLRRADRVVVISQAAADFVRDLAGRDAAVIYRGMRSERLDAATADEQVLERAAGRPVVAFVGRLIDGKGVPDLVRAFAGVREQALLCVVGDGPRRGELEKLVRDLGVADRVAFLGYLAEDRAWSVIQACDILVNPSYTEGLPTSVLEAALMAKAVLATDVGGTSEIVTDGAGAFLVAPRHVEVLRSRLEQLLADPALRRRMGENARTEAVGRFDWQASAARFLELARQLSEGKRERCSQAGVGTGAAISSSKTDS